ncbi:MAG: DMT family transporter [Bacteroidales bacterium]|nr:DMT family transporter [Bacteroidales bacterium]
MLKKLHIYLITVLAIVLWGMSYIWSDQLLGLGIPVEYFLFIRVLMAGIILLIINIISENDIRIHKEDALKFVLLAAFEPLIYFFCETYGIKFTESPTYAALIIATTPVFASFAGVLFFKEQMNWKNRLGILVCLSGLTMTTLSASSIGRLFILGVLLLLLAVFAEVGHASCTKALSDKYKPTVIVMYQFLIGSVLMLPTFLSNGLVDFDPDIYLCWKVFRPILCLAILCSSVAFSLWAVTIKHLGVAKSSIFLSMIPVVTAVVGAILGQEHLSLLQWCGIAVACTGLIMAQLSSTLKKS